jgi:hypothetical protein
VNTALAETFGSRFLADCERLVREARFDELISLLITHIDLVLSKSSDKGEWGAQRIEQQMLGR